MSVSVLPIHIPRLSSGMVGGWRNYWFSNSGLIVIYLQQILMVRGPGKKFGILPPVPTPDLINIFFIIVSQIN
jgi:hypothetical protein